LVLFCLPCCVFLFYWFGFSVIAPTSAVGAVVGLVSIASAKASVACNSHVFA